METIKELKNRRAELDDLYKIQKAEDKIWKENFESINGNNYIMDFKSRAHKEYFAHSRLTYTNFYDDWNDEVNEVDKKIETIQRAKPIIGNYTYWVKKFGCSSSCSEFVGGKYSHDSHQCKNVGVKRSLINNPQEFWTGKESVGCSKLRNINSKIADIFFENPPCKICIVQSHCNQVCSKLIDYNKSLKLRGKVKGYDPNVKVKINHSFELDRSYTDVIFGKGK